MTITKKEKHRRDKTKRLLKGNMKLYFADFGVIEMDSDEEVDSGLFPCSEHLNMTYDEMPDECNKCYVVETEAEIMKRTFIEDILEWFGK